MLGCNNFDKEMSLLFRTRFAGCSPCDKNPERVIDISEHNTTRDLEACIDGTRPAAEETHRVTMQTFLKAALPRIISKSRAQRNMKREMSWDIGGLSLTVQTWQFERPS